MKEMQEQSAEERENERGSDPEQAISWLLGLLAGYDDRREYAE